MFKSFIKETTFGITIILFALTVGFIALILPTFGNKALIVRSGSMEPAIKTGDLVIARPATYGVGDIIAFKGIKDESMVITHRITKVTKENGNISYQTKGDANDVEDGFIVPQKNVIGVAQYKISGVGKLFAAAKSRDGLIALVIGPAILLILFEGINLAKEIKKQKNPLPKIVHQIELYYKGPMGISKKSVTLKEMVHMILITPFLLLKFLRKHININFYQINFKAILPVAVSILMVNSSLAFFSDTETSTGNLFQAAESFCEQDDNGPFWASNVESVNQGNRKNGTDVLPERSNPSDTLGAPNGIGSPASGFFALGYGGTITVEFAGPVVNVSGNDLSFHEITNGRSTYPLEQANVEVSADGTTWYLIGVASSEPPGDGVVFLDISSNSSAPSQINFVKITDTTNASLNPDPLSDGYDVDAIDATSLCLSPSPSPSPSPSSTPTPTPTPSPTPNPTPSPSPQPGDVVINEINWVGSTLTGQTGQDDEWLELRNTTSNPIDLAGWKINGAVTGDGDLNIASGTIVPNGFFLISNFNETTSRINVTPDLVTTDIQLDNANAQYTLKDNLGNTIDTADDNSGVALAGTNGPPKRSMERKTPSGDGTTGSNWQDASTHTNMDGSGSTDEFGTPKAPNGT